MWAGTLRTIWDIRYLLELSLLRRTFAIPCRPLTAILIPRHRLMHVQNRARHVRPGREFGGVDAGRQRAFADAQKRFGVLRVRLIVLELLLIQLGEDDDLVIARIGLNRPVERRVALVAVAAEFDKALG